MRVLLILLLLVSCGNDNDQTSKKSRRIPTYSKPAWPNPHSMQYRGTKLVVGSAVEFTLYNKVEKCVVKINTWSSYHICTKRSY